MEFVCNVPDSSCLVTYAGEYGFCLSEECRGDECVPVVLFPVFSYRDFLFSFSSEFISSAPLFFIRAIDVYSSYVSEVYEFGAWVSFSYYLRCMGSRSSRPAGDGLFLDVQRVMQRILFMLFREFYLFLYANHIDKDNGSQSEFYNDFRKFSLDKQIARFEGEHRRFYINSGGRILYCYCYNYDLWPRPTSKRRGIDDFLLATIKHFPQYFCIKPKSFLHEEYISGRLSHSDPWYYFYLFDGHSFGHPINAPQIGECTVSTSTSGVETKV